MPIYEYVCKACGEETEILHKFSDPAPKKCPKCGKSKLEKMVSAAGFRLAGGGWYETDFKSGNMRNLVGKDKDEPAAAAPAKAEAKSDTKGDAKPDSKPDAKADSKADSRPDAKAAAKPEAKGDKPQKTNKDSKKPPAKAA